MCEILCIESQSDLFQEKVLNKFGIITSTLSVLSGLKLTYFCVYAHMCFCVI